MSCKKFWEHIEKIAQEMDLPEIFIKILLFRHQHFNVFFRNSNDIQTLQDALWLFSKAIFTEHESSQEYTDQQEILVKSLNELGIKDRKDVAAMFDVWVTVLREEGSEFWYIGTQDEITTRLAKLMQNFTVSMVAM